MHLKNRLHDLLRWSEAYTKTDMLYAAHGGFWLTLAKVVGMTSSLLLAVAMANLIPPEVFGNYKFVLSAAGIIGAFTLTGTGTAIIQAVARGYEGALRAGMREYLKWNFISIPISLVAALYYFVNGNAILGFSFVIVAVCNPLLVGSSFFSQFVSGKKDFRTGSIFDSIADVVPAAILIGSLFFTKNPALIILVYFLAGTGVNLLLYRATLKKYCPNDSTDIKTVPYSIHLSAMGVVGKIAENIDKILVFHYLGAAQLAIYAFAQTPVAQIKLLNDIPAKLALPKLSERDFSSLKRSLPRKVILLVGVMLIVVISYILVAPLLFELLFPKYLDSVIFTQVLALSLILAPGSMFGEALTAHMKKKELYIAQTVLPLTKIGLFLLLLPPFGIWGAISAIIASQFLMFVLYAYQFLRAKDE